MTPSHSQCERAQELVLALIDPEPALGMPSDTDQAFLEEHINGCAQCRAYRETMRTLTASLREMPLVEVPVALGDRIFARLEKETSAPAVLPASRRPWPGKRGMLVAASMLLLALAIPFVLQQGSRVSPLPLAHKKQARQVIAASQPASPSAVETREAVSSAAPAEESQTLAQPQPVVISKKVPNGSRDGNGKKTVSPDRQVSRSLQAGKGAVPSIQVDRQHVAYHAPSRHAIHPAPGGDASSVAERSFSAPAQQSDAHPVQRTAAAPVAIASAVPSDMDLNQAFGGDTEGSVYYDPVSELVGF